MRHLHKGRKLNRTSSHRRAMFNNMLVSLIKEESIFTTDAKAKELRGLIDRMITYSKKNTNATVRQAKKYIKDKEAFSKLFRTFPERFADRNSHQIFMVISEGSMTAISLVVLYWNWRSWFLVPV